MDLIGFWCLGAFVVAIAFRLVSLTAGPLLEYDGPSLILTTLSDWADESFQTIGTALFLSLPLAAVGACYALGRALWSLVA